MYLRHTTRRKDGKVHKYWRLVRSVRIGRKVVDRAHGVSDTVRDKIDWNGLRGAAPGGDLSCVPGGSTDFVAGSDGITFSE